MCPCNCCGKQRAYDDQYPCGYCVRLHRVEEIKLIDTLNLKYTKELSKIKADYKTLIDVAREELRYIRDTAEGFYFGSKKDLYIEFANAKDLDEFECRLKERIIEIYNSDRKYSLAFTTGFKKDKSLEELCKFDFENNFDSWNTLPTDYMLVNSFAIDILQEDYVSNYTFVLDNPYDNRIKFVTIGMNTNRWSDYFRLFSYKRESTYYMEQHQLYYKIRVLNKLERELEKALSDVIKVELNLARPLLWVDIKLKKLITN